MELMFVEAFYDGEIRLDKDTLSMLKKFNTVAIFSSVQFVRSLGKVISQMEKEGIVVISTMPDRASERHQLLGCDVFYKNLKLPVDPDAFLYVGDGMFHPQAIAIAQKGNETFREIICFDPISNKSIVLTKDSIRKIIMKSKFSLNKFHSSDVIGVLVSTKYGQEHMKYSKKLEKRYPKKRFYYFLDDNISLGQLDNFPFIQAWVNTACPRIALDDILDIRSAIVNINEILI